MRNICNPFRWDSNSIFSELLYGYHVCYRYWILKYSKILRPKIRILTGDRNDASEIDIGDHLVLRAPGKHSTE